MKKIPRPDWKVWRNVASLTMQEAAALTMDFCPNEIKNIRGEIFENEVFETGGPTLFGVAAVAHGMDSKDVTTFEERVFILDRAGLDCIATSELSILARKFDWSIPADLNATKTNEPVADVKAVVEVLTENERVKLLKHIGALALLLAHRASLYAKGNGDPNAKQIAEYAAGIIDDLPGRSGAGNSSLRKSIKEGIELLKM